MPDQAKSGSEPGVDPGMRLLSSLEPLRLDRGARFRVSVSLAVSLGCFCAATGLCAIPGAVAALLHIWGTDDLRSMGLVVPLVSFASILRSWRSIGWRAEGSWWGVLALAVLAALTFLQEQTFLTVTVHHGWLVQVLPLPLIAVAYAASIALLVGGLPLLRAAWFGVLFMGMVIPVPHIFSSLVDLPLQHASASVARGFAHALGQRLTEDKLRLMFTPDFGMFIAPGCNGIRGSVTLGLAAVVVSYVYRFRWFVYAPIVAGAIALGYVFNFLRLCLLVVYYKLALPYPWLQARATGADFLIGGALFCCALAVFFTVANRLRRAPADTLPETEQERPRTRPAAPAMLWRVAALLCLAAVFGVDAYRARALAAQVTAAHPVALPHQLGAYTLQRTWDDTNPDGSVVYSWGDYARGDGSTHVALGISPVFDAHDVEICHLARGERPVFHGQAVEKSLGGDIDLTVAMYNDGALQWLEASTLCNAGACHEFSGTSEGVAVVYARPHRSLPLTGTGGRQVPVLLRVEAPESTTPDASVRPLLLARLQDFLQGVNLLEVTEPSSHAGTR